MQIFISKIYNLSTTQKNKTVPLSTVTTSLYILPHLNENESKCVAHKQTKDKIEHAKYSWHEVPLKHRSVI